MQKVRELRMILHWDDTEQKLSRTDIRRAKILYWAKLFPHGYTPCGKIQNFWGSHFSAPKPSRLILISFAVHPSKYSALKWSVYRSAETGYEGIWRKFTAIDITMCFIARHIYMTLHAVFMAWTTSTNIIPFCWRGWVKCPSGKVCLCVRDKSHTFLLKELSEVCQWKLSC